jgi:hypothetical protein
MRKQHRSRRRCRALSCTLFIVLAVGLSAAASADVVRVDVPAARVFGRCGPPLGGPLQDFGDVGTATSFGPPAVVSINGETDSRCPGLLGSVEVYDISSTNEAEVLPFVGHGQSLMTDVSLLGGVLSYSLKDQDAECSTGPTGLIECSGETVISDLTFAGSPIPAGTYRQQADFPEQEVTVSLLTGACGLLQIGTFNGTLTLNRNLPDAGGNTLRIIPVSLVGTLTCTGFQPLTVRIEDGVEFTKEPGDSFGQDNTTVIVE